ncbi:MAG: flagellar hook-basal body complex protein FliE [Bdellovibrionota bacterium]
MDGLTIRNGQSLIDTGKTSSELRSDQFGVAKPLAPGASDPSSKSFADTLKDAVGTVNTLHIDADKKAQALATGKTTDIPEVMMAAEKADIALRMMVQVRNKIIDAYQDVMKMQV